jgi:Flp pilus assembly protein TadD
MQRKKGRREDALDARLRAAAEAYRRGDLAAAEKMCREVLKARPGFAQALLILGTVLGQTGRVEAAVPLLSRAAIAAPGNPDVHYSLGMALMGTGKWAEAGEAFATVTRLAPGHPFAHNNLGIAQRRLDDLASAISRPGSIWRSAWWTQGARRAPWTCATGWWRAACGRPAYMCCAAARCSSWGASGRRWTAP